MSALLRRRQILIAGAAGGLALLTGDARARKGHHLALARGGAGCRFHDPAGAPRPQQPPNRRSWPAVPRSPGSSESSASTCRIPPCRG